MTNGSSSDWRGREGRRTRPVLSALAANPAQVWSGNGVRRIQNGRNNRMRARVGSENLFICFIRTRTDDLGSPLELP